MSPGEPMPYVGRFYWSPLRRSCSRLARSGVTHCRRRRDWDKAQISNTTGALLFLEEDRLLKVHYLTSSTDRRGAVTLAAQAMQRLSPQP